MEVRMSVTWVPVLLVAIIVVGAVGGSLGRMVLKELLPLLRSIAESRQPIPAADLERLAADMAELKKRLTSMEHDQQQLREEAEFVQRLLATRSPEPGIYDE
jgi:hypothetical protein